MCTENFQMYRFRKGRGTRGKSPTSVGSQKKQGNSRKIYTSPSLTRLKPLTVWITTKCAKFLKRWEYQPPYLSPKKPVCRSRSNNQNQTWKNRLVPNQERSKSDKYHMVSYVWNLKHNLTQMSLFTKQKQIHIQRKTMATKGESSFHIVVLI